MKPYDPQLDPDDVEEQYRRHKDLQKAGYYEKDKTNILNITVDFYIDSIREYNNLDNFIYELQEEARNIIGGKFITIIEREVINKRKNFNW